MNFVRQKFVDFSNQFSFCECFENVEIVVIETLNINDVKKIKYVNFYSFVLETSETFVQNSNIDEKKSEKKNLKTKKKISIFQKNNAFQRINRDDELCRFLRH